MLGIPSIDTLRALEAAARLESYSAAAREMNLTHGAVSHRLRSLERALGKVLFERRGNAMLPTAEGRRLAGRVRQAFDILAPAFEQATTPTYSRSSQQRIAISVVPAFATFFLADRLHQFHADHPHLQVDLHPNPEAIPLGSHGADVAIRYGVGPWAQTAGIVLPSHDLIAVASPQYAKSAGLDAENTAELHEALAKAVRLRHRWLPWSSWLRHAGLTLPEPNSGPLFEESTLLLRTAIRDGGVALIARPYVMDQIATGELQELALPPFEDRNRFHVLWAANQEPRPAREFADWLSTSLLGCRRLEAT